MDTKENVLMGKYEVGKLLGQGAFAKVYYGKHMKTEQGVAIKVIDKEKVERLGLVNQIEREIFVMKLVKHHNITEIYEVLATKTKIYFVIEYAKGGELFQKVTKKRLKESTLRRYFQQLIFAVNFCHKRGVYHRDLKPENLLLDEYGCLKVSDFGLSALSESKRQDGLLHTACGTPAYAAPEVIFRKGYDGAKADIWSCGVVLFVLLAGHLPFYDQNIMEMYRKIRKADYKCPDCFSPQVRKLLSRMLDPNPQSRISIDRIMESTWFRKGLDSKPARDKIGDTLTPNIDTDDVLKLSCFDNATETKLELTKPAALNAFDIVSHFSSGLDLSSLFVSNDEKDEAQFTSIKSASSIISKLEEIAHDMKLEVTKNNKGLLRMERPKNRRSAATLTIDIDIFEITTSFHLVALKKSSGNTRDFQNILKQEMIPALGDIIWAWQGKQRH